MDLGLSGLVAAVGTTIGLALCRPMLARHVLDAPNARSSHLVATPRGGGVGVLLGLAAGVLVASAQLPDRRGAMIFTLAVTLFAVLGLFEDVLGLPVPVRLLSQVLLSVACVIAVHIATLDAMSGIIGLWGLIGIGLMGVFYVNAANFMDGVNGISGLHGLIVGAYFSVIGFAGSSPTLFLCGLAVSTAFGAFLPWNTPLARMFLGDVGSYLLGSSVWLLAAGAIVIGTDALVGLCPLVIYSLDVTVTLVRRAVARANLFAPHRAHTYQQIQQITGSHSVAAMICSIATLLCVIIGWFTRSGLTVVISVPVLAIIGVGYLATPILLRSRLSHRWGAS